jgi:hypothetical protein
MKVNNQLHALPTLLQRKQWTGGSIDLGIMENRKKSLTPEEEINPDSSVIQAQLLSQYTRPVLLLMAGPYPSVPRM